MHIDRILFADLGNPTKIAVALLAQIPNSTPPIRIYDIAYAVGITDIRVMNTDAFEGMLVSTDDKRTGMIIVRNNIDERCRFTVGHELGHYLNPWHQIPDGGFTCSSTDMRIRGDPSLATRPKLEAEANEFATAILMPQKLFCADLKKLVEPGLDHVIELARRYKTSKLATARRFISLHGDPKAIVLSKDGVFDHCIREQGFPYITLQKGQPVDRRSLTAMYAVNVDECSNVESAEPSHWVAHALPKWQEMFEQVVVQSNGYRITLLSIERREGGDNDERSPRFAYRR